MSKKYTTNFLEDTNGSTGSANQVLISTPTGIDWVDGSGSSIIGGPYLPLTAGSSFPLTGELRLGNGSYTSIDFNADPSSHEGNGGLEIKPVTVPGSGTANWYTRFASNVATGTTRHNVTIDGNVGIGTTSPGVNFQVGDGTADTTSRFYHDDNTYTEINGYGIYMSRASSYLRPVSDASQNLFIGTDSNQWGLVKIDATHVRFSTNGSENMRIDSSGNVGIGTTNPDTLLDVSSESSTIASFRATGGSSNNKRLEIGSGGDRTIIKSFKDTTDAAAELAFSIANSEAMRIDVNGNVGIGTTSPSAKLDVNGVIRVEGGTYVASADTVTNAGIVINEDDYIYTKDGGNLRKLIGKGGDVIRIGQSGTSLIDGIILQPGTTGGYVSIYDNSSVVAKFVDGNLGIGTTSPSEKLEVDGNVKADTLIATDLNAGYVPYNKSGVGLDDSKIYTNGASIAVGLTTFAAGSTITALNDVSAAGYRVSAMQTAPPTRGSTGTLGEIRITADYIYVCYATDSWRRVALSAW